MLKKFCLVAALCAYAFGGCESDNIKGMIKALSTELPMNVDGFTTCEKISCKNDTLIYEYSLKDSSDIKFGELSGEQKDQLLKAMGGQIKSMCPALDGGALGKEVNGITYIYNLEDGKPFGEVKLKASECK